MSAADPHTDDLADRLEFNGRALRNGYCTADIDHDLRAAAAELRRLRHRDAALTRLLDAMGETSWLDWWTGSLADIPETLKERLRRIAAAVEGIDQEELSGDDWAWAEEHRGGDL